MEHHAGKPIGSAAPEQPVLSFIPERNACFKRAGSGVDAPPRFIFF